MSSVVNVMIQPIVFELVGFSVPPGSGPLLFCVTLFAYLLTLLTNGVVAGVIALDKSLHRPMFIMICHLVACDLLGTTGMLPRLMVHFVTGNKQISHGVAITQALCIHTYGASMQTILAVMAYDRYVAVCEPLRYTTIMTSTRLHICCSLAWLVSLLSISVLFFFHINIQLCGNVIQGVYCSNRGILALACSPSPINNLYGLTLTWTQSTSIFLVIAFSYMRILQAGIRRDKTGFTVNMKALRTCVTHLVVYLLYIIASLIIIVTVRFPSLTPNVKKFCSILFIVVPPAINPVIYGLISKELRNSIIKQFRTRTQKS
uniref:G-protein coupled receptors family 1 profile domain-containing protein n=1 Tax=Tetraodon nigroviridis TaxID=99883 RepID=H3CIE4_TETNG